MEPKNQSQKTTTKKRTTRLRKSVLESSPAVTRSSSKTAGKRTREGSFESASQDSYFLENNKSPKRSKVMNSSSSSMEEGGSTENPVIDATESWADALNELDQVENDLTPLPNYEPTPQEAQASSQPALTYNLCEGMFRHYLDQQTTRINLKTEKLTVAVKAQGGVLKTLTGQVQKLDNSSDELTKRMKEMEAREIEREKRFNDRLAQLSSEVNLSKLGQDIAKAKREILFFKVPWDPNNKNKSNELVREWVESCKDQEDIKEDIKSCHYKTIHPRNVKKNDPHRMVQVTCLSEDVRKGLLNQLKKENKLSDGVSVTEVYPEKYRNKARDLNRVGSFIRGISNNVVKFKVLIDKYELQLRLKFTEDDDFIIQKSWTPPQGTESAKVCIDYGVPNTPAHEKNDGKKGTPLAPSVFKIYAATIQINSKTEILNTDFPTHKAKIESEWQNKPQKVRNVLPGGKKSLYVTFENQKQASEAFDSIKQSKAKYWPQMTTIYMVNFNV